jgi:hypothetical protein
MIPMISPEIARWAAYGVTITEASGDPTLRAYAESVRVRVEHNPTIYHLEIGNLLVGDADVLDLLCTTPSRFDLWQRSSGQRFECEVVWTAWGVGLESPGRPDQLTISCAIGYLQSAWDVSEGRELRPATTGNTNHIVAGDYAADVAAAALLVLQGMQPVPPPSDKLQKYRLPPPRRDIIRRKRRNP